MLRVMTSASILDLVRCPACFSALEEGGDDSFRCAGAECEAVYPSYAGLPWLFRDVEGSRSQWADKVSLFRQEMARDRSEYEAALETSVALESVRTRLSRQVEGVGRLEAQILALLAPFDFASATRSEGLPTDRIPSPQHVASYLETAFRDWCWGESEVEEAERLVTALLEAGGASPHAGARVLVLGGGAGRLAWTLSNRFPDFDVVQLDLNPLLTLIGSRCSQGESLELTELPRFPLSVEDAAVDQTLAAPTGEGSPIFLLGDAFRPPFAPETFDLLITPWFLDIVPESLPGLSRRLARLLKPEGRWLGFGPLSFEAQGPEGRFTPEEVIDVLEGQGFEIEQAGTESVSYLHSPHSMQRRGEEILAFAARRTGSISDPVEFAYYPEWITNPRVAIPEDPGFDAMRAERIFDVEILKCIDGRASIEDIVLILSSRYSLPAERCRNLVDRFFARWFEGGEG